MTTHDNESLLTFWRYSIDLDLLKRIFFTVITYRLPIMYHHKAWEFVQVCTNNYLDVQLTLIRHQLLESKLDEIVRVHCQKSCGRRHAWYLNDVDFIESKYIYQHLDASELKTIYKQLFNCQQWVNVTLLTSWENIKFFMTWYAMCFREEQLK